MSLISNIVARQIMDSRGNPTVQVEVYTEFGGHGMFNVPSGASTGSREAIELRDNDKKKFGGKSVFKAVDNVNKIIAKEIIGWDVFDQIGIDRKMIKLDGTKNKSKLGANAILGVSVAVAKAAACELEIPLYKYLGGPNAKVLPVPMLNVINGGEHADNTIDFQEFMIMPVGAKSLREAVKTASEIFHTLKNILHKKGHITTVGDEGGFAPDLATAEDALDILVQAIKEAGYQTGEKGVMIAMDPAASELYNTSDKLYHYKGETKAKGLDKEVTRTTEEQVEYIASLINKYPIISMEDGLAESDWVGFKMLKDKVGNKAQIMGDDLFVTNTEIIQRGIKEECANSVLIKVNQIGTLTESIDAVQMTQKAGWTAVVSHRSGETEDSTIADIAVALNTGQIKTGSMSRSDRIAKYNRLMQIEDELGEDAQFLGIKAFYNLKKNV
ncbi:phosphopyruvate hydratase [Spiroplasma endosymbiont of Amphibalanus improvisus]|uniref:phosphopyruvate hydratase n=1 Tax=Spiroplasma endosymbiont of Amphibalanus improvisus TaxID=3066327 RepID=UPI00313E43B9